AAEQRDEFAPLHVWMAPVWQEIIWRAAQRSLAVMCPACWCSPGGLLALMGSANRGLIIRAGSMSKFSASGCRRCRAAGRRADREGATLSDATYHNDCAVSCWRPNRRSGAHHGGTDESFARPVYRYRKRDRRKRHKAGLFSFADFITLLARYGEVVGCRRAAASSRRIRRPDSLGYWLPRLPRITMPSFRLGIIPI